MNLLNEIGKTYQNKKSFGNQYIFELLSNDNLILNEDIVNYILSLNNLDLNHFGNKNQHKDYLSIMLVKKMLKSNIDINSDIYLRILNNVDIDFFVRNQNNQNVLNVFLENKELTVELYFKIFNIIKYGKETTSEDVSCLFLNHFSNVDNVKNFIKDYDFFTLIMNINKNNNKSLFDDIGKKFYIPDYVDILEVYINNETATFNRFGYDNALEAIFVKKNINFFYSDVKNLKIKFEKYIDLFLGLLDDYKDKKDRTKINEYLINKILNNSVEYLTISKEKETLFIEKLIKNDLFNIIDNEEKMAIILKESNFNMINPHLLLKLFKNSESIIDEKSICPSLIKCKKLKENYQNLIKNNVNNQLNMVITILYLEKLFPYTIKLIENTQKEMDIEDNNFYALYMFYKKDLNYCLSKKNIFNLNGISKIKESINNIILNNESFINDMLSAQSYIDKINDIEKVVFNTVKQKANRKIKI